MGERGEGREQGRERQDEGGDGRLREPAHVQGPITNTGTHWATIARDVTADAAATEIADAAEIETVDETEIVAEAIVEIVTTVARGVTGTADETDPNDHPRLRKSRIRARKCRMRSRSEIAVMMRTTSTRGSDLDDNQTQKSPGRLCPGLFVFK